VGYLEEIWDLKANKMLASILGISGAIFNVALSPDGRKAVTAERGPLQVWDVSQNSLLFLLVNHTGVVYDVTFSADGKLIASGSRDKTARLWDAQTGAQIFVLRGHDGEIMHVAFSANGLKLLTQDEFSAGIWSTRTGNQLFLLAGDDPQLTDDGRALIINTHSGTKEIVIEESPQHRIAEIAESISRCLTLAERYRLSLDAEPPAWCIELEKWPYQTQDWKDWLKFKRANANPPLPDTPEWKTWRSVH
jgi:hypothetical protein